QPRAARLVAAQRVRDERRDRQVTVVLLAIVRPRDEDAVAVRDKDPGYVDETANVIRLIERLDPRALVEQSLAVLRHVGRDGARAAERASTRRQVVVHGAARG